MMSLKTTEMATKSQKYGRNKLAKEKKLVKSRFLKIKWKKIKIIWNNLKIFAKIKQIKIKNIKVFRNK